MGVGLRQLTGIRCRSLRSINCCGDHVPVVKNDEIGGHTSDLGPQKAHEIRRGYRYYCVEFVGRTNLSGRGDVV